MTGVMRAPHVERVDDLPSRVQVYEVGPRDGLQNETSIVPVHVKAELVRRLVAAGLTSIEVTSFVHPSWVPQLADAGELVDELDMSAVPRMPVLVPNQRGLERAAERGLRDIAIFGSATEAFARRNLNRSLDGQYDMFAPVVAGAHEAGMRVRGYVSMCFGDPWEGDVPVDQVVAACGRLVELGVDELSLGDTIGVATPGHVERLIGALVAAGTPLDRIGVHFHDTYGQGLANSLAALRCGVTSYDTSVGGLGGCPYAESATGNLATESLVWMLDGLGIETGVDYDAVVATGAWISEQIGR